MVFDVKEFWTILLWVFLSTEFFPFRRGFGFSVSTSTYPRNGVVVGLRTLSLAVRILNGQSLIRSSGGLFVVDGPKYAPGLYWKTKGLGWP